MIRVEGAEVIAKAPKSATGAYLKPLLARSTRVPAEAETQPAKQSRHKATTGVDRLHLIVAN